MPEGVTTMSQDQSWTLAELGHAIHAERLAEAEHERLARSFQKPGPSPRVLVANALRSLASFLDGQQKAQSQTDRRLASAV
jgi:hypothetical protein